VKTVKKFGVILCVLTLVFSAAGTASALNAGSWSLADGDLEDGWWDEFFSGGGHGKPGNVLLAMGDTMQWALALELLPPGAEEADDPWDWTTDYGSGSMIENVISGYPFGVNSVLYLNDDALWGEPEVAIEGVFAVNLSNTFYDDNENLIGLDFLMTITGSYNGLDIMAVAEFSGVIDQNYWAGPIDLSDDNNNDNNLELFAHWGEGFKRIELTITPEPGTMLLLGFGLIGLFALGRKKLLKK
jgi:hypothetical protein